MDGRVLINGVLEVQQTPENLWRSLIFNAATTRAVKGVDPEKGSGPLAVIGSFSSERQDTEQTSQSEGAGTRDTACGSVDRNVIIICLNTLRRKDNDENSEKDNLNDELHIYAQKDILRRLMEEKTTIEGRIGGVSMEWGTSSG
ncbi:unnamed protein product [Heligmosomoides polygyrus]|uniref:AAA_9 domain-containing protein n=1 Tax=Heligmosomoides polygyrus TaxID=6339 RepID=A0A183FEF0_HELPZ|nr:unnamed protein product [Heligmosomoides polygyrus]